LDFAGPITGVRSVGNGTGKFQMRSLDRTTAAHDQANSRSQSYWSSAIRDSWQKSTAGIIETGALLIQASEQLQRDVFAAMKLPFGIRTRQMLMRIAAHPILANHGSRLPPCWRTLYELCKLPNEILQAKIEDGTVNPDMERRHVMALLNALLNKQPKTQAPPKPDLLMAWASANAADRKALFARICLEELLGLIPPAMRALLIERLERHQATAANSSTPLAVSLSRLLKVALSSTHSNERENALAGINRKLRASGRNLHDIAVTMVGKSRTKRAA